MNKPKWEETEGISLMVHLRLTSCYWQKSYFRVKL